MPKDKRETIVFYRRGMVERWSKGDPWYGRRGTYRWVQGYSENSGTGSICYAWLTRRECQAQARAAGCKAVFVTEETKGEDK